jgi:hypothetical protein
MRRIHVWMAWHRRRWTWQRHWISSPRWLVKHCSMHARIITTIHRSSSQGLSWLLVKKQNKHKMGYEEMANNIYSHYLITSCSIFLHRQNFSSQTELKSMLEHLEQVTYHQSPKSIYKWSSIIVAFPLSSPTHYQHI